MPETVAKIVADVRGTFKDASPDIILDLVNTIHGELCSMYPIYTSTIQIPVVAGQMEYDIEDDVCWVRDARYVESEAAWRTLAPSSCQELDSMSPGWRWSMAPSVPDKIYVDSGKIGVVPAPSVSSVATPQGPLPRVEAVVAVFRELAHDSQLPRNIRTRAPWVNGARMLYAQMYDKQAAEAFKVLYDRSLLGLERMLKGFVRQYRIVPRPARVSSAVRQV